MQPCVSARLSPICSDSADLTLGEGGGVKLCVTGEVLGKNDEAHSLRGGQTLAEMEAVMLAA